MVLTNFLHKREGLRSEGEPEQQASVYSRRNDLLSFHRHGALFHVPLLSFVSAQKEATLKMR